VVNLLRWRFFAALYGLILVTGEELRLAVSSGFGQQSRRGAAQDWHKKRQFARAKKDKLLSFAAESKKTENYDDVDD